MGSSAHSLVKGAGHHHGRRAALAPPPGPPDKALRCPRTSLCVGPGRRAWAQAPVPPGSSLPQELLGPQLKQGSAPTRLPQRRGCNVDGEATTGSG